MLLTNLPFLTSCCEVTAIIKRVPISNNKAPFLTVECVMFVDFPLQQAVNIFKGKQGDVYWGDHKAGSQEVYVYSWSCHHHTTWHTAPLCFVFIICHPTALVLMGFVWAVLWVLEAIGKVLVAGDVHSHPELLGTSRSVNFPKTPTASEKTCMLFCLSAKLACFAGNINHSPMNACTGHEGAIIILVI